MIPPLRLSMLKRCPLQIIKKDYFKSISLYDLIFFIHYAEIDIGLRIRLNGGESVLLPASKTYHVVSNTTPTLD